MPPTVGEEWVDIPVPKMSKIVLQIADTLPIGSRENSSGEGALFVRVPGVGACTLATGVGRGYVYRHAHERHGVA